MLHRAAHVARFDEFLSLSFAEEEAGGARPGGGGWGAEERFAGVGEPGVPAAEAMRRQAEAVLDFGLGDRCARERSPTSCCC